MRYAGKMIVDIPGFAEDLVDRNPPDVPQSPDLPR
jgi:hypothetical protein